MGSFNGKPTIEKRNESGQVNDIVYATSSMQGWRTKMEDFQDICLKLPYPFENWSYFALFDGHGGSRASEICSNELLNYILETEEFKEIVFHNEFDESKIIQGIKNAFFNLDEKISGMTEGTTVSAVLITPCHLIFINCGDSRSILIRSSQVFFASTDHKPTHPQEKERILKAGGQIIVHRLNGNLSVSRALGDSNYKRDSQLGPCQQLISSEPDIYIITRNNDTDQLIILACDGLWDVFSNIEVTDLVLQRCLCTNNLVKISDELIDTALYKGSKDNISAIIIAFINAPRVDDEFERLDRLLDESIINKTMEYLYSEGSDSSLNELIDYMKDISFENLPPGGLSTKQALIVNLFEKYISVKSHRSDEFNLATKKMLRPN